MTEEHQAAIGEGLDGERTDKAVAVLAGVSRSVARAMIERGNVTVEGELVAAAHRVRLGDELAWTDPTEDRLEPEPSVPFDVLFSDEHLAVVAKPPGLVVHRGAGNRTGTLVNGLLARWPSVRGVGDAGRWGIVHRLDRDTSGALIVALTSEAHEVLSAAIARREVGRSYLALASGSFEAATGTIDAPIGRDGGTPTKMAVTVDGRPARTHYRRRAAWDDPSVTLLDVELETGRTHQIRVHLAAIGHSVVGDATYRPGRDAVEAPRVFLHARTVRFSHPVHGDGVEVTAPLPDDLGAVLQGLGPPDLGSIDL